MSGVFEFCQRSTRVFLKCGVVWICLFPFHDTTCCDLISSVAFEGTLALVPITNVAESICILSGKISLCLIVSFYRRGSLSSGLYFDSYHLATR